MDDTAFHDEGQRCLRPGQDRDVVERVGATRDHIGERTLTEDTEVGLFLLFHIDVEREVRQDLSIEFSQGVVTDYWVKERRS